jgi:hypothetical protein
MDSKGDMGFGEAMVATMAVVIVFNILAVAILSDQSSESTDPGAEIHTPDGSVIDGRFVFDPTYGLQDSLDDLGLRGISVNARFPGGLYDDVSFETGDMTGDTNIRRYVSTVTDDHGCHVVVVYEVTTWV